MRTILHAAAADRGGTGAITASAAAEPPVEGARSLNAEGRHRVPRHHATWRYFAVPSRAIHYTAP